MERIASFEVNHDILTKGMYISRIDEDIITYDIRVTMPNAGVYVEPPTSHTFEHLFATYVRNAPDKNKVVYVGPMGCRTGFYFLVRNMTHERALELFYNTLQFISTFEGIIPGATKIECGNYQEHNLEGAKLLACDMLKVLENWTVADMTYKV